MADDTQIQETETEAPEIVKEEPTARPREVHLRRREDAGYMPPKVAQQAKKRVGSVLIGQAPLRGLSFEDEKKYLPTIIGEDPANPMWAKITREFWADMTIDVPFSGVILQIGTDAQGEPLDIFQWVQYQWLKKHPKVTDSKEKMEADITVDFYIHDPEAAERKQANAATSRMDALTALIELRQDPKKMGFALRLLGNVNPERISEQQQLIQLETIARERPVDFLRMVNDKDLTIRAFLAELVETGVISKIGQVYNYIDQTVGESETEAINFLKNKRNSGTVNELKAKLKAARDTQA